MNPEHQQKIFFPNLDGLRFFSFLIVLFSHIWGTDVPAIKYSTWYQFFKGRVFSDGDLGVSIFFVLSGFLITYLLLSEKKLTGKIDVKSFYIRRALRIWPLYYFSVFFGFVIFPLLKNYFGQGSTEAASPALCSLFLNNFDRIKNGIPDSSILSVLWSVAIEEQFYLLWPILFLISPAKKYIYIFLFVLFISTLYRIFPFYGSPDLNTLGVITDMAVGGLAAYLVFFNKRFLVIIENTPKILTIIPYLMLLIFIFFKYQIFEPEIFYILKRLIMSLFFAWIILDQNFGKKSLFKFSQLKTITKLGKYTYGLYCLHTIAVLVVIELLSKFGLRTESWQLIIIEFPLTLMLSILISILSYKLFESKFLKLKDKFAYIVKN